MPKKRAEIPLLPTGLLRAGEHDQPSPTPLEETDEQRRQRAEVERRNLLDTRKRELENEHKESVLKLLRMNRNGGDVIRYDAMTNTVSYPNGRESTDGEYLVPRDLRRGPWWSR